MWEIRYLLIPDTGQLVYASLCNYNDSCYMNASNIYMNRTEAEFVQSSYDCPQQCAEINFPVERSSSSTPMEWEMPFIKRFVENSSVPLPANWSTDWKTNIRENFLAISLVRETTVVENRTQSATFGLVDVLSNIGGQMGLWIGISLLSFMELLEMLFRLIHYECSMIYSILQRKKQIQNQSR